MFLSLGMQTSDGLGCVLTRVYEVYCAENQARLSFKTKDKTYFSAADSGQPYIKTGEKGDYPLS